MGFSMVLSTVNDMKKKKKYDKDWKEEFKMTSSILEDFDKTNSTKF